MDSIGGKVSRFLMRHDVCNSISSMMVDEKPAMILGGKVRDGAGNGGLKGIWKMKYVFENQEHDVIIDAQTPNKPSTRWHHFKAR